MRYFLLMIAVVALVGCGKKTTTDKVDGQPVNPSVGENKPEEQLKPPKVVPKKLITNPIVEAAIRKHLKKPTGELTKADLKKVTRLWLRGIKLTEVPKGLEKLTQLTSLHLDFNQLTDVKGLWKLTKLTRLDLNDNQLTDVKGLEKLAQLTRLRLDVNKLTNVKGLEKLTQLTTLQLEDNPDLTKTQIDQLKKALPKCFIWSNATK